MVAVYLSLHTSTEIQKAFPKTNSWWVALACIVSSLKWPWTMAKMIYYGNKHGRDLDGGKG